MYIFHRENVNFLFMAIRWTFWSYPFFMVRWRSIVINHKRTDLMRRTVWKFYSTNFFDTCVNTQADSLIVWCRKKSNLRKTTPSPHLTHKSGDGFQSYHIFIINWCQCGNVNGLGLPYNFIHLYNQYEQDAGRLTETSIESKICTSSQIFWDIHNSIYRNFYFASVWK